MNQKVKLADIIARELEDRTNLDFEEAAEIADAIIDSLEEDGWFDSDEEED